MVPRDCEVSGFVCAAYEVVVIDSIQTMYLDTLDSAPGTVAQVRTCAAELIRLAKRRTIETSMTSTVMRSPSWTASPDPEMARSPSSSSS
ncbi:hypothetical protein B4Q13_19095 [Lacticaseibacillus rhamnosus]